MDTSSLLFGVAVPAVVTAVVLASVLLGRSSKPAPFSVVWAGAVAFAGGYCIGHGGLLGWPAFPPHETTAWIPYTAIVAAAAGGLEAFLSRQIGVRVALRALAAAFALWFLMAPLATGSWTLMESVLWLGGSFVAVLLVWLMMVPIARDLTGPRLPLVWVVIGTGAAIALLLSGSAKLGQLCGVLTACAGGSMVFALLHPALSLGHGSLAVIWIVFVGLVLNGVHYSELPVSSAALLGAAPLCALPGRIPIVQKMSVWKSALLCAFLTALPVAAAVLLARSGGALEPYNPYQ